jgi:hypothetical protein
MRKEKKIKGNVGEVERERMKGRKKGEGGIRSIYC